MSVVVGVLVALAVAAVTGTSGRRLQGSAPVLLPDRPVPARRSPLDLGAVLRDVAAQLRAGAGPAQAWSRVLGVPAAGPVPSTATLLTATSRTGRRPRRGGDDHVQRVRAVTAAAQLSEELGAPLAGVLDRISTAVAADEEAQGEREAALAGPRSTAQVLAWLPLLGVALGALLGADPVGVVLSGGLGTMSAVLGAVLLLAGRGWTAALLSRAAGAGDPPARAARAARAGDVPARAAAVGEAPARAARASGAAAVWFGSR